MNKYLILLLTIYAPAMAEIGCMDNSYHLSREADFKNYNYVQCNCPCKQYRQYWYRGYHCMQCKHAHDPALAQAVRNRYSANALNAIDSPQMPLLGLMNMKPKNVKKCQTH